MKLWLNFSSLSRLLRVVLNGNESRGYRGRGQVHLPRTLAVHGLIVNYHATSMEIGHRDSCLSIKWHNIALDINVYC